MQMLARFAARLWAWPHSGLFGLAAMVLAVGHDGRMTSRLVTPWWADRRTTTGELAVLGSTAPTRLLDWESSILRELIGQVELESPIGMVQQAHRLIAQQIRPVYAVQDSQPASKTLALGRGSCSQRLSVLEAVARSLGIATRVRGLLIDGKFWYPRFPHLRFAVPSVVVLAWPEFLIEDSWVSASDIFEARGLSTSSGFTNTNGETLFEALTRTTVDWDGSTSAHGECSARDLSAEVTGDLGRFGSRDELFALHGQTLCWGVRKLSSPVLSRWSAGAAS